MIDGCPLSLLVGVYIIVLFFAFLLSTNDMILARNLGLFLSLILSTYTQVYYFSVLWCVAPLSRCYSFSCSINHAYRQCSVISIKVMYSLYVFGQLRKEWTDT